MRRVLHRRFSRDRDRATSISRPTPSAPFWPPSARTGRTANRCGPRTWPVSKSAPPSRDPSTERTARRSGRSSTGCRWPCSASIYGREIDAGCRSAANFYKCGDETEFPHYGAWSPVETPAPDFHRPEFFGEIVFA
ncbi:MAG: carbohydrate-binding family 9-like protein [Candidatus Moduliflexus flocculans]|nr:carbohydrate-binding family 9-like protein [Candidatus Moduliflexus flocculans]